MVRSYYFSLCTAMLTADVVFRRSPDRRPKLLVDCGCLCVDISCSSAASISFLRACSFFILKLSWLWVRMFLCPCAFVNSIIDWPRTQNLPDLSLNGLSPLALGKWLTKWMDGWFCHCKLSLWDIWVECISNTYTITVFKIAATAEE